MYKIVNSLFTKEAVSITKLNDDGSGISIPFDPANTDYQAYLAWLAEGNEPEAAD